MSHRQFLLDAYNNWGRFPDSKAQYLLLSRGVTILELWLNRPENWDDLRLAVGEVIRAYSKSKNEDELIGALILLRRFGATSMDVVIMLMDLLPTRVMRLLPAWGISVEAVIRRAVQLHAYRWLRYLTRGSKKLPAELANMRSSLRQAVKLYKSLWPDDP